MISGDMSLEKHFTTICQSVYAEIRRISSVRRYLTVQVTKTLVCAFVLSKLDYCNSLLSGCPLYIVQRLQKVQNSAARLILKTRRRHHVQPFFQTLHWLLIQARIDYKLSILCHSFFLSVNSLLTFLKSCLSLLRSSADTRTLRIPHVRTNTFIQTTNFLLL